MEKLFCYGEHKLWDNYFGNKGKGIFEVQGVKNIDKRIQDFWNTINGNKVNRNLLRNEDVQKVINI